MPVYDKLSRDALLNAANILTTSAVPLGDASTFLAQLEETRKAAAELNRGMTDIERYKAALTRASVAVDEAETELDRQVINFSRALQVLMSTGDADAAVFHQTMFPVSASELTRRTGRPQLVIYERLASHLLTERVPDRLTAQAEQLTKGISDFAALLLKKELAHNQRDSAVSEVQALQEALVVALNALDHVASFVTNKDARYRIWIAPILAMKRRRKGIEVAVAAPVS